MTPLLPLLPLLFAPALAAPPTGTLTEAFACRNLGDMVGPEDYAVLDQGGARRVLVSANRYRPQDAGPSEGIFALDLATGQHEKLALLDRDGCSFHPHGVDIGGTPEAPELYAVVHFSPDDADNAACKLQKDARGEPLLDAVERLAITPEGLRFLERLQDPLLTEPNDLVVTDAGQIFLSNNPQFSTFGLLAGLTLGWRPSVVLAYTPGAGFQVAARRFFYSNGVLLDDQGDLLVASYGKLTRFEADADGWERAETLRFRGAMDNLMVGEDGRLWVAGHPSAGAFSRHAKDGANIGPSVAYALSRNGEGWAPEQGWLDETGTVSASSTASKLGEELVFAQVFQPGLVACAPK